MSLAQYADYADEYICLTKLLGQLHHHGEPQARWVHRASKHIVAGGNKLGIFSGSFNPLTVAHAKMIAAAAANFNLQETVLLLAKANVDKNVFGLSLADRLLMLKRYAVSREDVSVAACSHGRFIEKLRALEAVYPPNTYFSFIVGYDTFVRIFDPKYYTDMNTALESLFDRCRLIVANRESENADAVNKFLEQPEIRAFAENIDIIELPCFYAELSSTQIRTQIARGDSIDSLVPPSVRDFLSTTNAYQS